MNSVIKEEDLRGDLDEVVRKTGLPKEGIAYARHKFTGTDNGGRVHRTDEEWLQLLERAREMRNTMSIESIAEQLGVPKGTLYGKIAGRTGPLKRKLTPQQRIKNARTPVVHTIEFEDRPKPKQTSSAEFQLAILLLEEAVKKLKQCEEYR